MSDRSEQLRQVNREQLASYRRQGVERVFLLVCDRPQEECRAVARRLWTVADAAQLPMAHCPLVEDAANGTWHGCLYAPHFGALIAVRG